MKTPHRVSFLIQKIVVLVFSTEKKKTKRRGLYRVKKCILKGKEDEERGITETDP